MPRIVNKTPQKSAAKEASNAPEHLRLDPELKREITAHHAQVNKKLFAETGVTVTRAEVIRSLLRAGLAAARAEMTTKES